MSLPACEVIAASTSGCAWPVSEEILENAAQGGGRGYITKKAPRKSRAAQKDPGKGTRNTPKVGKQKDEAGGEGEEGEEKEG